MSWLEPVRHDGVYAFVTVSRGTELGDLDVVASVVEPEGLSVVLPVEQAESAGFEVLWRGAWLTLRVQTSLDMVGLTARCATALAARGIACNVVAGARHDHMFVPVQVADLAIDVLTSMVPPSRG